MHRRLRRLVMVGMLLAALPACARAQAPAGVDVRATVVTRAGKPAANVVVWLTPMDEGAAAPAAPAPQKATLLQKNKQFEPHLLVVPVGTVVDFPNADPFFHNVFSMFNGKRFDLGLYESGSRRSVRFDREGVSLIFCNIHPEMGAVVVALATPYFATSTADGRVALHDVPEGRYRLSLWSEHFQAPSPEARVVTVRGKTNDLKTADLGRIEVAPKSDPLLGHQNKFGEAYPHTPSSPY